MGLLRAGGRHLLGWPRGLGAALAVLWIVLLHAGSLVERRAPAEESPPVLVVLYNWLHCPAYAALAVWMLLALRPQGPLPAPLPRAILVRAWLATALVGLSDEIHQAAVPWRDGDPLDFATDALAAAGALWYLAGAVAGRAELPLLARLGATLAATLGTAALAARGSL
jgi:hypothetical protein